MAHEELFAGGGEIERLARAFPWEAGALGPPASWPATLRTALRIVLGSRYPLCVWWGPELVNLYNAAYIPILGQRHPMAFGRPASEVWTEAAWLQVAGPAQAMLAGGPSTFHERMLLVLERNGFPEECYVTFSQSPIRDEEGRVGGLFCACTEETRSVLDERRMKALRELAECPREGDGREICQRLAQALAYDAADVPFALIYLLDADGVRLTRAACAGVATAHPAAAFELRVGVDPWDFAAAHEAPRSIALAGRFPAPLPGGTWSEPARRARIVPIRRADGARPAGFLVAGLSPRLAEDEAYRAFIDLAAGHVATALAAARAQVDEQRRLEELARLDRAKTVFFSNVSHELRTPLTLIRGPVEEILAGDAGPVTPALRTRAEMLRRNALRLHRLVNSLLEFARAEAGRTRVTFEPMDLAAFTREVASAFKCAMARAGLAFRIDCPPIEGETYVDRELWEKIVLNLVANALKYTLHGEVRVSLADRGHGVALQVADTGIGIPDEERPRIFERFHRVEGAAGRTDEGAGIGLALVQEFVRLHGGSISVESRPGVGSLFSVEIPKGAAHLPRNCVAATAVGPAGPTAASTSYVEEAFRWLPEARDEATRRPSYLSDGSLPPYPRRQHGKERILVADDDADMRQYVTRLLRPYYDVEAVQNGQLAIASALMQPPDLVLTDAMMPGIDGFEVMRQLKDMPRTAAIPVILLSARAGEEASVEALAAGADDYLVKPFGSRELLARVAARIEIHRLSRESERRIARAEQRLRLATEAAGIYSWEVEVETRVLVHSANAARVLGFELPRNFDEIFALVHPDDRVALREAFQRAMREGRRFEAEFRFLRPGDGQELWQLSHGVLLEAGARTGARLIGITQDITARKRAEIALRRDELNAQFLNQLDLLISPLGEPQEILALCMQRLGEFLGADRCYVSEAGSGRLRVLSPDWAREGLASIAGSHPLDVPAAVLARFRSGDPLAVPDVAQEPLYESLRGELAQRGIGAFLAVPYHGEGEWEGTLVVATAAPTEWRADQLLLVRDVTMRLWPSLQRARYERSLRESEARFRAMADSSPVMIWVTDGEGRLTFANRTYLDFFGLTRERVAGLEWQALVHPEDRESFTEAFHAAVRDKAHFHFRARVQRRDGRWRWIESRGNPRLDEEGRVQEFIGSSPDVTEFYESQELLRQADRRKDEFLAMLAHELRNPLAPIVNATRALRRLDWNQPEATGMRELIERQTEQLTRLVDDLLDVSRITRGVIVLRKENVELLSLVARALEMCRPLLDAHRHHLKLALPPVPVRVEGDATRLAQVISNLLNNAAKYTDDGGEIALSVVVEGPEVVLRVADNGMGIPASELPHVFDLFSQGERSLDRSQGGLGIGLTVVKQLVQMHGGRVEARSDGPGRGSEFIVWLPLAHGHADKALEPAAPPRAGPARPRHRILVVDDNIDSATSMALLLKLDGYDVKLAHDGPEAIALAREFRPALVLLDIGLPSLSGYEVAHRMRADPAMRDSVLVAMTGYGQAEDRVRTRAAGFDHHLTKPVDEVLLTNLLEGLPVVP